MVAINTLIKRYLAEKEIRQTKLAEITGMSRQMINHWLKKSHIPTDVIIDISRALRHDFFADLSAEMRKEMGMSVLAEPNTSYGTNSELMKENLELYRELREKTKELERLKAKLGANL